MITVAKKTGGSTPSLKNAGTSDIKALKQGLKRGTRGGYLKRIPADGITGRFMDEPDAWYKFFEHYDENREDDRYFPCVEGDCDGCDEGLRATKRWLVNFLDTSENKVYPLVLPASLVGNLLKKYDKFKTMLDRDYELTKEGTGLDTEYDVFFEGPSKVDLKRYVSQKVDLEETLLNLLAAGDDDEDDEEDDDTPKKKGGKGKVKKSAPVDDDDDEDDDEDEAPVKRTKTKSKSKPLGKPSKAITRPKTLGRK